MNSFNDDIISEKAAEIAKLEDEILRLGKLAADSLERELRHWAEIERLRIALQQISELSQTCYEAHKIARSALDQQKQK